MKNNEAGPVMQNFKFHKKFTPHASCLTPKRAFTLIELAIVVLIIGLVLAGAIQLTTSMQQGRGDQTMATDMRTMVQATQRFLNDNVAYLSTTPAAFTAAGCGTTTTPFCSIQAFPSSTILTANNESFYTAIQRYLPPGFNIGTSATTTNPTYMIGIARLVDLPAIGSASPQPVFRAIIARKPDQNLSDTRLSRTASLLGTQGGIFSNITSTNQPILGNNGAWSALPANYGLPTTGANAIQRGSIVGYTVLDAVQMNTNQISRVSTGNPEANTMRANLNMGGNATTDAAFLGMRKIMTSTVAEGVDCSSTTNLTVRKRDNTGNETPDINFAAQQLYNAIVTGPDNQLYQCRNIPSGGTTWLWKPVLQQLGNYYVYGQRTGNSGCVDGLDSNPANANIEVAGPNPLCAATGIGVPIALSTLQPASPTLIGLLSTASPPTARSLMTPSSAIDIFTYSIPSSSRSVNTWYNNNSANDMKLTVAINRNNTDYATVAVLIKENMNTSSPGLIKKVASIAEPTTAGITTSTTVMIPAHAWYAVAQDTDFTILSLWSEYR